MTTDPLRRGIEKGAQNLMDDATLSMTETEKPISKKH